MPTIRALKVLLLVLYLSLSRLYLYYKVANVALTAKLMEGCCKHDPFSRVSKNFILRFCCILTEKIEISIFYMYTRKNLYVYQLNIALKYNFLKKKIKKLIYYYYLFKKISYFIKNNNCSGDQLIYALIDLHDKRCKIKEQ